MKHRPKGLGLLLALLTVACQQLPGTQDGPTGAGSEVLREQREWSMNGQWQNRPFSELVSKLGKPILIMDIPGGGTPPGFAAVYGIDPVSGCVDAFALIYGGDPTVRMYHCR